MCDLVCDRYPVLLIMSRFGIALGFGDKTIGEVCLDSGVDTATFLAVVNMHSDDKAPDPETISVAALVGYLRNSHVYFLDFRLPAIRRKLIEAIDCSHNDVAFAILRFFDEYVAEVHKHMDYEEQKVFPYVEGLLRGEHPEGYSIDIFRRHHDQVEAKLAVAEPSAILRCGIIAVLRRLPAPDVDILEIADISQLTVQLSRHRPDVLVVNPASLGFCTPQQLRVQTGCEGLRCIALQMSVTDAATLNAYDDVLSVYDPVETLREKIMQPVGDAPREERQEPLSAREREIVVCIVKGMTNKQIADALCISTHTVITHRRNIVAKLQIHSPAGLTIYAIVNKLVDLSDIRDTIAEI